MCFVCQTHNYVLHIIIPHTESTKSPQKYMTVCTTFKCQLVHTAVQTTKCVVGKIYKKCENEPVFDLKYVQICQLIFF